MIEFTLATWPERQGAAQFGIVEYPADMQCGSFWLSLRTTDKEGSADYDLSHIGLYIWFDDRKIVISPRVHGVHSMELYKLEKVVKFLRKMCAKVPGEFRTASPFLALAEAFDALKIKRATEYRYMQADQYPAVLPKLSDIANIIEAKREGFK
jgi:hypothetical protein